MWVEGNRLRLSLARGPFAVWLAALPCRLEDSRWTAAYWDRQASQSTQRDRSPPPTTTVRCPLRKPRLRSEPGTGSSGAFECHSQSSSDLGGAMERNRENLSQAR